MALSLIRAQIKTLLEGVPNVGLVHDYERWIDPTNQQALLALIQPVANGPIQTWIFYPTRVEEFAKTNLNNLRIYTFTLDAYYSVKDVDATGTVFSDLLETVVAEFRKRSNNTLNSTAETIRPEEGALSGRAGLQLDRLDFVKLANVLCHRAQCTLGVQEFLAVP